MSPSSHPQTPRLIDYGDSAILIQYDLSKEDKFYSKDVNQTIHQLANTLRETGNWLEIVPGYDSLLCVFDLTQTSTHAAKDILKAQLKTLKKTESIAGEIIEIPIVYGGEYGPDMKAIKSAHKLSQADVIKLHSQRLYDVCMMGFIPGFAFLSEAPAKLHHPRHATPRPNVRAGSVGIAGWQTGIYGQDSPGGWQIIGRTPLKIFDKSRKDPFLVKAGDQIQFVPIEAKFFEGFSA